MQPERKDLDDLARMALLKGISRNTFLYDSLVLKGGLALWYAYDSPRRSFDVDLDTTRSYPRVVSQELDQKLVRLSYALHEALQTSLPLTPFRDLRIQKRRLSDEIPTLMAHIGYATSHTRNHPAVTGTVPVQVTLCEVVCESTERARGGVSLHVPVIEDILAEKLKAMAQQIPRRRSRSTDVFDIWYFTRRSAEKLRREVIGEYFHRKMQAVSIEPSADLMIGDVARAYAGDAYASLAASLPADFALPPFGEAFAAVREIVDDMGLLI
ncbi:MAG: nucleotidyl transferase AbiEii/AbiGii toxin family protein [Bacteroidota bacterium]